MSEPGAAARPGPRSVTPLRQRLRGALTDAIKGRDKLAAAALRSALAAIDNAEAVDRPASAGAGQAIGQVAVGAGSTEAARRELTEEQMERIVRGEVAERESAARDYERAGRLEHAERLRAEINVLAGQLGRR